MTYVMGFLAAVPESNKETYRRYSEEAAKLFREYGATRCTECWGDQVPEGKTTDFLKAVKAKDGEVVVFSWLEFPSKQEHDKAMEAMMSDPRTQALGEMPFDGKRMVYGSFDMIVDA